MRRTVVFMLCLLAPMSQGMSQASTDEATLHSLMHAWTKALVQRDTAALYRIIAPDYLVTPADGNLLTRDEDLAWVKSGQVVFDSASTDSLRIRVFGTTGIVTGIGAFYGHFGERPFSARERFTEVFLKRDGRWQVVASHSSTFRTPRT